MKNLYDITPIQTSNDGSINGGSEYCKSILMSLLDYGKLNMFDVIYDGNLGLNKEMEDFIKKNKIKKRKYYNHEEMSAIINSYDLFFSAMPYIYYDLNINNSTKVIYTIHGLRDIEMPYNSIMLQYNKNVKSIIKSIIFHLNSNALERRAIRKINNVLSNNENKIIVVDSEHTKYSMLANLNNLEDDNIKVIYPPLKRAPQMCEKSKETDNYVLMVSGDRWLKNDLRAAIAIDELISEKKININVIITGVKNEKIYTKHIKNNKNFIFYKYVEHSELELLYRKAYIFMYPSLNEGFGYPPMEAMKYGVVCLCAADSSIMEVCGDGVLYFNPTDIKEMKTRILCAMNKDKRKQLESKIIERYNYIKNRQLNDLNTLINLIVGEV